jgi:hypothetical protein
VILFFTTQRIRGFLGIDIIQYARFDLIGLFFCPPLIALRLWALGACCQQMQAACTFTLARPSSTIYVALAVRSKLDLGRASLLSLDFFLTCYSRAPRPYLFEKKEHHPCSIYSSVPTLFVPTAF